MNYKQEKPSRQKNVRPSEFNVCADYNTQGWVEYEEGEDFLRGVKGDYIPDFLEEEE